METLFSKLSNLIKRLNSAFLQNVCIIICAQLKFEVDQTNQQFHIFCATRKCKLSDNLYY